MKHSKKHYRWLSRVVYYKSILLQEEVNKLLEKHLTAQK